MLQQIGCADADIAALTVRAYLRLRRAEDARRHLDLALRQFCMAPDGLLAREASEALRNPDLQTAGWVGLRSNLEFHGELASASIDSLKIRLGDLELAHPVNAEPRDGRTVFSFQAPQSTAEATLHVSCGGVPLLGSPRRLPLDFALDGRADSEGERISGWARVGWLPTQPVELSFEDEDGQPHRSRTTSHRSPRVSLAVRD